MNPSESLRDIRGLETVSGWPWAPGWWLLLGALLIGIGIVTAFAYRYAKRRAKNNWHTIIHREWRTLVRQRRSKDLREQVVDLSMLLKRIAIQQYGRTACAGLSGKHWLIWLTQHDPKDFNWLQLEEWLVKSSYGPPTFTIDEKQLQLFYQAVEAWIEEKSY